MGLCLPMYCNSFRWFCTSWRSFFFYRHVYLSTGTPPARKVLWVTMKSTDDSNALHDGGYLMQRAKLFEHYLHTRVNNIQITWKTIHLSVFCRTNSPYTDQSRAEGNNKECVGKKRFNGRVLPTGFGKSMCYVPLFWTRYYIIFFLLMVICNSLLLLKSLDLLYLAITILVY